jgi:hypothetical protein
MVKIIVGLMENLSLVGHLLVSMYFQFRQCGMLKTGTH